LGLYADAWRIERKPLFKRVAEETAAWTMREMQSAAGGYYSSLDADSEGAEGRYYVWSREQVRARLDDQEYAVVSRHYGLDRAPNFEHKNWHLHVFEPVEAVASQLGVPAQQARRVLDAAREKLLAAREQRVRPQRDEKILVSWNALMIRGMARAARIFGRDDWCQSARRAASFIAEQMFDGERLLATCKDGRAHLNAYLDDYAYLMLALLELMQMDFRSAELEFARALGEALLVQFEDADDGGFYFVSHEHEPLILRPKSGYDNATPSGNAVAALALLRLGYLLGDARYLAAAERALRLFVPLMEQRPAGFATMNLALGEAVVPTRSVILRGNAESLEQWRRELADDLDSSTLLLALELQINGLPQVLDKPATDDTVNAYLCEGVTCREPVRTVSALRALLETARSAGES
jgi:uncharacterized protein YyaL (SSP411 family)